MADAAEDTTQAPPQNAPPQNAPPQNAPPKRWGDEEDDPVEEPSASSSNSEEKAASELKVEALTINDDESKINKFLDEPQDSNITAVRSLWALGIRSFIGLGVDERMLFFGHNHPPKRKY
jgi:hypothetical protein